MFASSVDFNTFFYSECITLGATFFRKSTWSGQFVELTLCSLSPRANVLTHFGLVTPYGDIDLGQHWLRQWHVVWRHQAITWANIDSSSVKTSDTHLRALWKDITQPPMARISLKIIIFHPNLLATYELINFNATTNFLRWSPWWYMLVG